MRAIAISFGGALGALTRYFFSTLFEPTMSFPLVTFSINLIGSFLFGFLSYYFYTKRTLIFTMMTTGFLGGFTTFSAFSLETISLLENEHFQTALLYICTSVLGGIICALFGAIIGRWLRK
jgi:fluoride exporter